jgi:hypothetical protein
MIHNNPSTHPLERQFEGFSTLLSAALQADSTFRFVPLEDTKLPPIKEDDDIPLNDVEGQIRIQNYLHVMDPRGLVRETDPKKDQRDIWATARAKSDKRPLDDICRIINPPLDQSGIRMTIKTVQSINTRVNVALMSVHESLDGHGIIEVLTHGLVKMEGAMFKKGLNKKFSGQPFPTLTARTKNIWEPPSATANRIELQRRFSHFKNAWHIEASTDSWERLFPIFLQARVTGVFTRYFGAEVDFIPVGIRTGRMNSNKVNDMMRNIRTNMGHNITMGVEHLTGIVHPNHRFAVAYADGRKPSQKYASIRGIFLNIRIWDTAEQLTSRPAFDQMYPTRRGQNANEAAIVYFNDAKGIMYKGSRRQVNGPISTLLNKILANPPAWVYGYAKEVLGYTEKTLRAMMQGVDPLEREVVDVSHFNAETMEVTSPLNSRSNYANEADRLRALRGIEFADNDLAGMLADKQQIDDEEAEAQRLVKSHNLYVDGEKRKVGASNISLRSDNTEASSQPSECRSTNPMNLADNYRKARLDLASSKAARASDQAQIAELLRALQNHGVDTRQFATAQATAADPLPPSTDLRNSVSSPSPATDGKDRPAHEADDGSAMESADDQDDEAFNPSDDSEMDASFSSRGADSSSSEGDDARGPRKP